MLGKDENLSFVWGAEEVEESYRAEESRTVPEEKEALPSDCGIFEKLTRFIDIERYSEILRDVEIYWKILRDIKRYWKILR